MWGLRLAPGESVRARLIEHRWRWPTLAALAATIPAFYEELLEAVPPTLALVAYAVAGLITAAALLHTAWASGRQGEHLRANALDLVLIVGLLLSALMPASSQSLGALSLRLAVAFLTLIHIIWSMQHLLTRGGMAYLMTVAVLVLGLCGVGFWWLEPRATTLSQGLWLAFTTAATVGYGDIVPSTPSSKIFSVFVVMLGYGVLSLVTAAIATNWVETEERIIEREILRDVHRQMDSLREEIAGLRQELLLARQQRPLAELAPDPAASG
jgi:voltage-gated potassium channel